MKKTKFIAFSLTLIALIAAVFSFNFTTVSAASKTDVASVTYSSISGTNSMFTTAKSNNGSYKYNGTTDYFKKLVGDDWYLSISNPTGKKMVMKFSIPGKSSLSTTSSTTNGVTTTKVFYTYGGYKSSVNNDTTHKYSYNFSSDIYGSSSFKVAFSTSDTSVKTYTSTSGTFEFNPNDTVFVHIPVITRTYDTKTKVYKYVASVAVFKVSLSYKPTYINGQSEQSHLSSLKFGSTTISNAGCGLIAAYNVGKLTGHTTNFYSLLKYANGKFSSITYVGGITKANMESLIEYTGATATKYTSSSTFLTKLNTGTKFVVLFNWGASGLPGHYVSGYKTGDGKYVIYNRYSNRTTTYTLDNLSDLWTEKDYGYFNCGWVVK